MVWPMIILFVIGISFMILELIIPGFGIAGILSIISLVAGVIIGISVLPTWQLVIVIFLVVAIALIMIISLYRSATRGGRVSKLLFLNTRADKESGYTSSDNYEDMVGEEGIATTALRPSGTGEFQGVLLDVIADGQFISKGARIRIIKVEGFRILVEEI